MQFLESSALGLRAAIYDLNSPSHNLEFVVFPMVHIGDPLYYKYIEKRLDSCDNVIYEGVKSKKAWFLVKSYKIVTKRKSLGLVTQSSALKLKMRSINLLHGDVSEKEFNKAWRNIPIIFRSIILVAAPLYGIYRFFTASRNSLASGHSLDDLSTLEDYGEAEEAYLKVIKDDRDIVLIDTIEKHIESKGEKNETTAIVYGAQHMPAVITALSRKYGYSVTKSEWVNVI